MQGTQVWLAGTQKPLHRELREVLSIALRLAAAAFPAEFRAAVDWTGTGAGSGTVAAGARGAGSDVTAAGARGAGTGAAGQGHEVHARVQRWTGRERVQA